MQFLKKNEWVNDNGNFKFNCDNYVLETPSEKEIQNAFTKLNFRGNVLLKIRKKKEDQI